MKRTAKLFGTGLLIFKIADDTSEKHILGRVCLFFKSPINNIIYYLSYYTNNKTLVLLKKNISISNG